jgi:peptide-methionine (S)-S-oxide reductase
MLFRNRSKETISTEPAVPSPPLAGNGPAGAERATFAAGCFWGVEAGFREIEGVLETAVGYTGGTTTNPTYRQVCGKSTGHAEAVEVWFDPTRVSYEELLGHFWGTHNPTTRNRQGVDIGSQYRSAVFTHSDEQADAAISSRDREQAKRKRQIVTEIAPASRFYRAEEYHQRYFEKSGRSSCAISVGQPVSGAAEAA